MKLVQTLLCLAAVVIVLSVGTTSAQDDVWTAHYFSNPNLAGEPDVRAEVAALNLNWDAEVPIVGIPEDNFSARFSRNVFFEGGTYRFYATANDSVRVWLEGQPGPIIDTFGTDASVDAFVTADVTIPEGVYPMVVEYADLGGSAYLFVTWSNLADAQTVPLLPQSLEPPIEISPWTVAYYTNTDFEGEPFSVGLENDVTHNWGDDAPLPGMPENDFAVRFTSTPNLPAGTYELRVFVDDGVRVYVNDELIIDEWHPAAGLTYFAAFDVPGGPTDFRIDYYDTTLYAYIDFNLAPATQPLAVVDEVTVALVAPVEVLALPDITADPLTALEPDTEVTILGRTEDGVWAQVAIDDIEGWVPVAVLAVEDITTVPVVEGFVTTTPFEPVEQTGAEATRAAPPLARVLSPVDVLDAPDITTAAPIARLEPDAEVAVLARTEDSLWIQVQIDGQFGWVPVTVVDIPALDALPVIPLPALPTAAPVAEPGLPAEGEAEIVDVEIIEEEPEVVEGDVAAVEAVEPDAVAMAPAILDVPIPTDVDELADDFDAFLGLPVALEGTLGENIGPYSFVLRDDDLIDLTPDQVLVFDATREGISFMPLGDARVVVIGVPRVFVLAEIEAETGLDLDDELYVEFEGLPMVVAVAGANLFDVSTMQAMQDNPGLFLGHDVGVVAEASDPLGPRTFVLQDEDLIDIDPEQLLVIDVSAEGTDLATMEDSRVLAIGTVRTLVLAEIEAQYGLDIDDTLLVEFEGVPVLIAHTIYPWEQD